MYRTGKAVSGLRETSTALVSMDGVGKQLDKAKETYDKAFLNFIAVEDLIKQANEFKGLGVAVQKNYLLSYVKNGSDYNKLNKNRSQCGAFLICVIPKAIKAADTANKRILPMNAAAKQLAINKYQISSS